ncbi:MAG: monovalent cation/H(+) antiporter subunit G [Spirochaetales bacterium]|nr:monovalent cation/H(+) antiporter subunit G [Spirochaetales bacterium]
MIWAVAVFLALGVFFGLVGNLGVLRFPDLYTRLHASAKCSTTTVVSVFIACVLLEGFSILSARIAVIALFFLLTGPVTAHIIGRRAWKRGVLPWRRQKDRET